VDHLKRILATTYGKYQCELPYHITKINKTATGTASKLQKKISQKAEHQNTDIANSSK
jgi:hypothetical protein